MVFALINPQVCIIFNLKCEYSGLVKWDSRIKAWVPAQELKGGFTVDCQLACQITLESVPVRQTMPLLHTSFSLALSGLPLCFTSLHLHQVGKGTLTPQVNRYARHTILRRRKATCLCGVSGYGSSPEMSHVGMESSELQCFPVR
jgi:hypothetical protein